MSFYFPQAAITLRVLFEDFGQGQAKLQELHSLRVLARSVEVNLNDYTQADTFSCEIDYKQLPFDPRAIRSCGVTISMQNMRGTPESGKEFSVSRTANVIEPSDDNTIFIGFADDDTITFDEERRTVRLEGRDFTALLLDQKYTAGPIDLAKPLDKIIRAILDLYKETRYNGTTKTGLQIDNRVREALPNLGAICPDFNDKGQTKNVKRNESPWDVIQDLVARAGLIAYVELDKLVISKPRVLYDAQQAKRFVYGKNLSKLELKRKIGRMKNFNVACRSLSIETKEVLLAKIPLEATAAWSSATGIPAKEVKIPKMSAVGNRTGTTKNPGDKTPINAAAVPEDEAAPYLTFRFPNVKSKAHLIKIGEKLYEELGRQQLEGNFSTREMETMDGLNQCFDLLKLRIGTPVQIQIDQADMEGLSQKNGERERSQFLQMRGYTPQVANILAQTLKRPSMIFYTRGVRFSHSDQGFSIDVEFINFIELPEKGFK